MSDPSALRPSPANPTPLPSVTATRKAAIDAVIRRAIADHHRARTELAEAESSIGVDSTLDPMMCVLTDRARDAATTLLRAILATESRKPFGYRIEKRLWPACGVFDEGHGYFVAPAPDNPPDLEVGAPRPDGCDAMHLTVFDLPTDRERSFPGPFRDVRLDPADESVSRLATQSAPDRAEAPEDLDDAPTPRHGGIRDHRDAPQPFFRQTMTFCPPWDHTGRATVEIIALADGVHLDDVTAGELDLPELREAGWHCLSGTPISLYARFIV